LAILQLVGATTAYIRIPLILQGCFEGLIGSELGLGLFYLLYRRYAPDVGLREFLSASQVFLIILGVTLIGLIGGLIPLRRPLHYAR
jgi:cell division transport system permease protein